MTFRDTVENDVLLIEDLEQEDTKQKQTNPYNNQKTSKRTIEGEKLSVPNMVNQDTSSDQVVIGSVGVKNIKTPRTESKSSSSNFRVEQNE